MTDMKHISWITTSSSKAVLKFTTLNMDAIVWNRAGKLRYFPPSFITNLKNTLRQIKDRPTQFTDLPPQATMLMWNQGLPLTEAMHAGLKKIVTG